MINDNVDNDNNNNILLASTREMVSSGTIAIWLDRTRHSVGIRNANTYIVHNMLLYRMIH